MRRPAAMIAAAWLTGTPAAAAGDAHDCFLFSNADGYPLVRLTAAAIDSIGRGFSDDNLALIEGIEEAYQAGRYGKAGSDEAREEALAALIYNSRVAFDFVMEIALQDEVIYTTSEDDLREAFTRDFRNPGVYPIMNLLDARAGFGRFCMKFEVDDPDKREIVVSGEKMRAWTEDVEIDDVERRVVNIDMKTFSHDRVHVVYERFADGFIRTFDAEVQGFPVRVVTMEELEGQYIRKFGLHKPAAVVLWKSPPGSAVDPPRRGARFLGAAVYVPRLQLKLPWFLPNIGFNDLKKFEFPEPVLTMEATRALQERELDWLEIRKNLRLANWEGDGEVPAAVNERFPDY